MADDAERLARDAVEMFNRAEWDRLPEVFADDILYSETGTGRRVSGLGEFRAGLEAWRESLPDVRGEVLRVVGGGDECALEIRWRGTQDGPLLLGEATLPPSGRETDTLSTLWVRSRGGRIVEQRHHLDVLTMLTQLGALPAPASA